MNFTARLTLISLVFLLVPFSAGMVLAQSRPLTAPEALKDIQPAGQACRRDEIADKPNVISGRPMSIPDMACAVSAQELGLWVKAGQISVIDTRRSNEYAQFHIDSALNLSAAEVVHKTQLRNKAIVLVGTGKLERELYAACADLKAKGFTSVKVLHGGMPAWVDAGQSVMGRAPPVDQLRRLEPSELLAESQFDANLVVVTPSETSLQSQLSYAVATPQESADALKKLLEQHRKEAKGTLLNAVVLVTSPKTSPAALAQWTAMAYPLPLLFYSEGVPAYQRYLTGQKAVWLAQARGPKQPACGL